MTVPYYGKREAGSLTAASPGDTIHFNFGSYNDSGDSEAMTGFAVTDIEVFKNGNATTRATDSGYSLISDTGQMGDRLGLHRFSVQLFNTADDTGHYESGAWYQVAVDSVTVDGKTVRFWAGSFEIGRQRVDVREFADTGVNNRLAVIASDTDTGIQSSVNVTTLADTGVNQRFAQIQSDVDTGLRAQLSDVDTGLHDTIADLDTGLRGILQTTGVNVTAFADTGVNNRLAVILADTDTGIQSNVSANVIQIRGDTGAASQLQQSFLTTPTYWQQVNVIQIDSDTGAADVIGKFGTKLAADGEIDTGTGDATSKIAVSATATLDTGAVNQAVWQANASRTITSFDVDTGLRALITASKNELDTGIKDAITDLDTGLRDFITDADTGIVAGVWEYATRTLTANTNLSGLQVNVTQIDSDTGFADVIGKFGSKLGADGEIDTGTGDSVSKLAVSAAATLDTGVMNQAVWVANASRTLTSFDVDTGLRALVTASKNELDTGIKAHLDDLDTGLTNLSVNVVQIVGDTGAASRLQQTYLTTQTNWPQVDVFRIDGDTGAANYLRATFADGFADTGINQRLAQIQSDVDTGLRAQISDVDTGLHDTVADLDTGLRGILQTTGVVLSSFSDTGVNNRLAVIAADLDTGYLNADVRRIVGDTGAADRLLKFAGTKLDGDGEIDTGTGDSVSKLAVSATAALDTGVVNQAVWVGNATRTLTSFDVDTGLRALVTLKANELDTGIKAHIDDLDTGLANLNVNVNQIRGDTGGADRFWRYTQKLDTGGDATVSASVDTGVVNQAVWQANAARSITASSDTGINDHLTRIRADADTGLRSGVWATASRTLTAFAFDTGVASTVWAGDTGLRDHITNVDTGLTQRLDLIRFDVDTGLRDAIADLDTGLRGILVTTGVNVSAFSDTGINNRLSVIAADTDTGIQSGVSVTAIADTGINGRLTTIQAKTDKMTFDTGNEILADIRKVNNVTVQGVGDTGTGNTWRPGT